MSALITMNTSETVRMLSGQHGTLATPFPLDQSKVFMLTWTRLLGNIGMNIANIVGLDSKVSGAEPRYVVDSGYGSGW